MTGRRSSFQDAHRISRGTKRDLTLRCPEVSIELPIDKQFKIRFGRESYVRDFPAKGSGVWVKSQETDFGLIDALNRLSELRIRISSPIHDAAVRATIQNVKPGRHFTSTTAGITRCQTSRRNSFEIHREHILTRSQCNRLARMALLLLRDAL